MLGLSWSECKPVLCGMPAEGDVYSLLALGTEEEWLGRINELSAPLAVKAAAAMGKGKHERSLRQIGVAWADVRSLPETAAQKPPPETAA